MIHLPQFSSARERTFWVQAQLRTLGTSFAAIAAANDWSRNAVSNAMYMPSDPQEKAIADVLGIEQQQLFPERFADDGRRLHAVKHTGRAAARNVKHTQAA